MHSNPCQVYILNHFLFTNNKNMLLLVIWSIAALIRVMRPRHLSLWRGTLHSGRRTPGGRPHSWTQAPRLVKRRAECALVLWKLGVVMMGWRGIDRGTTVLRGRPGWRMVHKRGHLTNEVSGRWGDGWGDRRQWRRGLVENHVRCVGALSRV